jgi:mannosyltransferase
VPLDEGTLTGRLRVSDRSRQAARDLAILTPLSFVVNFAYIGAKSIWLDEATSVQYATMTLRALRYQVMGGDPNMGFYYVLLNLWVWIFGTSESAVRGLSALCATLTVPVIYALGTRLFGRRAGIVAGVLFALNAFIVHYAQTTRSYALVVLLVTVSSYLFVLELEEPSPRTRLLYVLASALAFYSHYFAVFVLVAHLVTLVAMRKRAAFSREWLLVAMAMLLLCAPEIFFAWRGGTGRISWITQPSLGDVVPALVAFAGESRVVLLALLAAGCYALVSAIREHRWWRQAFVAAWLLVPVVLSFAVSLVRPMFLSYYLIVCVPALMLFGSAGIAMLRPAVAGGALTAILAVLCTTQLVAYYRRDGVEEWRLASRYILDEARAGDGVVFFPEYVRQSFEYYARRRGVRGPEVLDGRTFADRQDVWLVVGKRHVLARGQQLDRLRASLTERYHRADHGEFRDIEVEHYVR